MNVEVGLRYELEQGGRTDIEMGWLAVPKRSPMSVEVGLRCELRATPGPCSMLESFASVVTTTPAHSNRNEIVGHGVIRAVGDHAPKR